MVKRDLRTRLLRDHNDMSKAIISISNDDFVNSAMSRVRHKYESLEGKWLINSAVLTNRISKENWWGTNDFL